MPPVAVAAAPNGIPPRVAFEFASSEYKLRTYSVFSQVCAYCTLVNEQMGLSGQALMAKIAHAALISAASAPGADYLYDIISALGNESGTAAAPSGGFLAELLSLFWASASCRRRRTFAARPDRSRVGLRDGI